MHPMSKQPTTILLCGVGGQGTILAADLLAKAALAAGQDVKVSEIHGMAQRGGSVTTVVRVGEDVHSMVADKGEVDILASFELTEAMRYIDYLKEGGLLISNDESIKPMPVLTGVASMPADSRGYLLDLGAILVPALNIAREAGNSRTQNVVLLGALSVRLPIPVETWDEVIAKRVPPKTVETNLKAFAAGRAFALEHEDE